MTDQTSPSLAYPNIAARLFDTPLLLQPGKAEAIAWALREKMSLELERPDADFMRAAGPGLQASEHDDRRGYSLAGSVAVVPIHGTLVNRGAWIGASSGITSYEGISAQLELLADDDRVSAIMLDIDSMGGEASGVDDLAESIQALDSIKPVHAMIDGSGSSAAYWIASAARSIGVAQSSTGGSIGVVITHMDVSQAAERQGVVVTHIHAGANKVLGSPYRSLSEEDLALLQGRVDALYKVFVETVAQNRGIDPTDVRQTEAGVFFGRELVELGLADQVTTGRQMLRAIQANPSSPVYEQGFTTGAARANLQSGANPMQIEQESAAPVAETYTAEDVEALMGEARSEAIAEERSRISQILGSPEAEGREELASHLAMKTSSSVEDAREILGASPAASSVGFLDFAMEGSSPNVADDDGLEAPLDPAQSVADSILNS